MTEIAIKLIERLLAGLTAQTARDVLAAYLLPTTVQIAWGQTPGAQPLDPVAMAINAADAFMAERERRNRPGIPKGSKEQP